MGWLLKQKKSVMYGLVKHAVDNGLAEELSNVSLIDQTLTVEQLQGTLLEFLGFLEDSLLDNLENVEFDEHHGEDLKETLKKIDFQNLDIQTVWQSIQQTQSTLGAQQDAWSDNSTDLSPEFPPDFSITTTKKITRLHAGQQAQNLLYQNLLQNWNPETNDFVN